ncbi:MULTISPECIES: ATP-binding protein [Streptomyces]|uniref:ATP-binding protein n=1 Tax=Streptomyces lycii TaxID=2654337 RepID=A0ABQ7FFC0_9ACTN|nr:MULTISPECIES: ATP-binding protein [Streptomyces]KAF4407746.1 ATP-binding protein [Streptomyces lycii]PGH51544.1 ATP-binding protein [Streptomyces sp. Ru87]
MASGHSSRFELSATDSAPALARRHTRTALSAWRVPEDTRTVAELLVSELVTNAVQHGSGGGGEPLALELERDGPLLHLRVSDSSGRPPVAVAPEESAESGRGLTIVAALSKEWGHRLLPGGGKTVWCELVTG